jgi:hypothetical protein
MESKNGDGWGCAHEIIDQAYQDAAKMRLTEFETKWLDPQEGVIANLGKEAWFSEAKDAARKIAERTIRDAVASELDYYRFAESLFQADFE